MFEVVVRAAVPTAAHEKKKGLGGKMCEESDFVVGCRLDLQR